MSARDDSGEKAESRATSILWSKSFLFYFYRKHRHTRDAAQILPDRSWSTTVRNLSILDPEDELPLLGDVSRLQFRVLGVTAQLSRQDRPECPSIQIMYFLLNVISYVLAGTEHAGGKFKPSWVWGRRRLLINSWWQSLDTSRYTQLIKLNGFNSWWHNTNWRKPMRVFQA